MKAMAPTLPQHQQQMLVPERPAPPRAAALNASEMELDEMKRELDAIERYVRAGGDLFPALCV